MEPRSSLTKRTFVSKIDGKEYVRQMTYDECHELVHNEGRLLSEEYKGKFKLLRFFHHQIWSCSSPEIKFSLAFKPWAFRSDMKEIVAKSYIGVMHYLKFNKLNYTSIDNFFLAKFQSQIKHLVDFSDREWYSLERCRR